MSYLQYLNAPVGITFIDDGSLIRATSKKLRNGTSFNRSNNPYLYDAWKRAGYPGAKDVTFNANTAGRLVGNKTANSGTTDATGFTTGASSENATHYAYLAMDSDAETTYWLSNAVYADNYWYVQKDSGKFPIFGVAIHVNTTYLASDANIRHGDIILYDGSTVKEVIPIRNASWTATETKIWYPSSIMEITKVRVDTIAPQMYGTFAGLLSVRILPADLTKFKCPSHGFSTTNKVRIGTTGTLPTGLASDTDYYIRSIDTDNITLHPTANDATNNTNQVTPTDAGSGIFKIYLADTITLDTAANSYIAY